MNQFSNIENITDIEKTLTALNPFAHLQIKYCLKNRGQSITWVAGKLNIDRKYLSSVLLGIYPLTKKNRQKINELLNTDF